MSDANLRRGRTEVNLDLDDAKLTPRELVRLQRLARELRLTDQILSIDMDTVTVEASGPAPAWTTLEGDKVSFNWAKMPTPWQKVDVAVWLGTNAHELGHVLFSPRRDSTLMFRVLESERSFLPGIANMHNIVEDQRQERLVLAKFGPWRGYLTAALSHHLVSDDANAWLLLAGRTWLPDEVRSAAKARMVFRQGQRFTDEVTRMVGEYQLLMDPGESDADEAWQILQDLVALFDDQQPTGNGGCGGFVSVGGEPNIDGNPGDGPPVASDPAADPDADSDSDGGSGPEEGDDGGDGDQGSGSGPGDSQKGDADEGQQPGDEAGKTPTTRSDGQQGQGGDSGSPGGGAGNRPGSKPISQKDIREKLRDAAKGQIDEDAQASEELGSVLDALDYGRGGGEDAEGERPIGRWIPADDAARRLRAEVSDALLDIKDETEPGWLKRVESGRLNVRRLVDPYCDADELFDRYEPGMMDASEMEVMVLLDVSGSMGSQMKALGRAAWAIRHAVDDLEGRCTVICYESGPHRLLAEPGQRPDDRMFIPSAMGGTQPKSALLESLRVLTSSDAKNRLLIVLSDGEWFGTSKLVRGPGGSMKWEQHDDAAEVIEAMGQMGVTTVMALLGRGAGDDKHGCQFAAHIDRAEELARLFRRVAAERMRSWL